VAEGRVSLGATRRRVAVPLLALVLAATAAGCGGDSAEETYCATFLDRRQELSDLAGQQAEAAKTGEGVDVLSPTLTAFEELRGEAPEELRDEWDTLVFAYRDLADAVESSGLEPAEFQVGEVPEGLDPADRKALSRVASKLGSTRVVEAATGIEGYAAQVCEEAGDTNGEGESDGSGESLG
jgi:hypothetical protein